VFRRILLRSLALAAILAACFAHLIWNGWHAQKTVAENLPHPVLSSGKRDIDLWHPTASFGHVYDLTWEWPEEKPWTVPAGSRLEIQLSSAGRSRPLVVRQGHPNTPVSWRDVLLRRERLQVVGDRGWVDLGPLPTDATKLELQVYGLLPGPFGFAEQNEPGTEHFSAFRIRRPDSPLARPSRTIVRYRFRVLEPVPARETLARFFFFISCSRVLQVTGVAALALLFAGWWWLWEKRFVRAIACLVPAVTLLHACGLAPLQGEDEATHAGTVEAVLFAPDLTTFLFRYPASMAALYQRIGYDAWVDNPEAPVSALLPENRPDLRAFLAGTLGAEASRAVPLLRDAYVINPRTRAPLYYNAFRLLGPALRRMSILDRVFAYTVVSSLASLALFASGLVLLARAKLQAPIALLYGLTALWPYSVGVVASCSNYSLAIGIGQFLAACVVVAVLSEIRGPRLLGAGAFPLACLVGIGVWDDFVFPAVPSVVAFTILAAAAAWRLPEGRRRTLGVGAVVSVGTLATIAFTWALATGRIRRLVSSLGARLPEELGGFRDPSLWLLLAVAAAPLVAGLLLVLSILRARDWPAAMRERAAWIRTAALALLFVGMFLATRWTSIPFETARFDYPDEVHAHWASFWSNNLAFDQDVLSWKMYFGVFGYPDVRYPDALYAAARWAVVAFLVLLPVLSWRFTQGQPSQAAWLIAISGVSLAASVVTNSIRYFQPNNPWGRYVLPLFPLVVLPLLVRARGSGPPARLGPILLAGAIALHLWTAITLLGSRYALGT
jgi:hypothetical protein